MKKKFFVVTLLFFLISFLFFTVNLSASEKKPLSLQDIMKFKYIHSPTLSANGNWLGYEVKPNRGDGEAVFKSLISRAIFHVPRGKNPVISNNEKWAAAAIVPPFAESLKENKSKISNGMALINLKTGKINTVKNVKKFDFSENGNWFVWQHEKKYPENNEEKKKKPNSEKYLGLETILRHLETSRQDTISFLRTFSFDSLSQFFVYSISDTNKGRNGLYFRNLNQEWLEADTIKTGENLLFSNFSWHNPSGKLAFCMSRLENDKPGSTSIYIYDFSNRTLQEIASDSSFDNGWIISFQPNRLQWSIDGKRLFFGLKPKTPHIQEEKHDSTIDIYDIDKILAKKEVDVWHWNDPLIIPEQKKGYQREKNRTYLAVYHFETRKMVQLGDKQLPIIINNENPNFALGLSNVPYMKESTWDGTYYDIYRVDLSSGEKFKLKSHLRNRPNLSPNGRYIVFYENKHWHLYDLENNELTNLTENIKNPFYNEDHDYPYPVPGYGIAGWMKNDAAVLIYEKYDIWKFPTDGSEPINLTGGKGRKTETTFRIQRIEKNKSSFASGERLVLSAYHQKTKNYGFYELILDNRESLRKLIDEDKKFTFLAKAKNSSRIIYTREDYTEFPDIWVSDLSFKKRKKVTEINPQIKDFAWGSSELIEWHSADGFPLQGVLIKPGNYQPGKKYPLLVYFYRFFSQRLHEFNEVTINHRPCFPYYASHGYAIFLPDIRFEVGRPGFSSTKCLVPGVQKLIDMGIADPKAIALHGHSWSGYQTAFVITQTNIFTCAIAGAPVSNMTSAYSGIRWASGKARQFQYEKTQSRIGGSLWEFPERYIENSPVFFADKINTPLLIMHGDADGAVPWYQSIELYLAMRRLNKPCVFLEYRGEPHHPQKFPNKLDYTIKFKEFLDHFCKGAPAPQWWTKGVAYQGK